MVSGSRRRPLGVAVRAAAICGVALVCALAHTAAAFASYPAEVPVMNVKGTYNVSQLGCDGGPVPPTVLVINQYGGGSFSGFVKTSTGGRYDVSGVEAPEMANSENGPYYPPHITMTDPTGQGAGDLNGWVQVWTPYTANVTSATHATEIDLVKPPFGCESDEGFLGDIHLDLVGSSGCPSAAADTPGSPLASAAAGGHCTTTMLRCPNVNYGVPSGCLVIVTDQSKHPTRPTGNVILSGTASRSSSPQLPFAINCPLKKTPGNSRRTAVCEVEIVSLQGSVTVNANYVGDAHHAKSSASGGFTVGAPPPGLTLKQILQQSGIVLEKFGEGEMASAGWIVIQTKGVGTATAGALAGEGAIIYFIGDVDNLIGNALSDPPDFNVDALATPRTPPTPDFPAGSSPMARTSRALLANAVSARALARALHACLDRAVSAGKFGDLQARSEQILAAIKYLKQLAALIDSDISLQRSLARELAQKHLATVSIPPADVSKLQVLLSKGLPNPAGSLLRTLGFSPADISSSRARSPHSPSPASCGSPPG